MLCSFSFLFCFVCCNGCGGGVVALTFWACFGLVFCFGLVLRFWLLQRPAVLHLSLIRALAGSVLVGIDVGFFLALWCWVVVVCGCAPMPVTRPGCLHRTPGWLGQSQCRVPDFRGGFAKRVGNAGEGSVLSCRTLCRIRANGVA